ncbi:MAG: hypothetical protein NZ602_14325, partial [Thermoguttaceae bacterium]|nr:hypothetical protein [Thermoguttaceae bacterium]MDW8037345.1 hypothetical protein [Thermoguttaceae bacterium]
QEKPKSSPPPESPPEQPKPEEKAPPGQPQPEKPLEQGPQILGQLLSDREVLLRADPVQKDWWRIAAQGNVLAGERLLSLPMFRPVLGLVPGVTATLIGPTQVELLTGGSEQPPGMKILFGKLRLSRVGTNPVAFRIQVEGLTGILGLLDPDATVAIAVARVHIPGNDPTLVPDPVRVEVYATRGRANFAIADGAPLALAAPGVLSIEMVCTQTEQLPSGKLAPQPGEANLSTPDSIPTGLRQTLSWKINLGQAVPLEKVPDWIMTDTSSPLERQAAAEVEQKLQPDRLARISLMELLEDRRLEVRTFASRSLGYLGEYQHLVARLNKTEERAVWFDSLELLQEAIGWGAESATSIRQTFEKQFGGQNGALLYRILLGYSETQLLAGEATTLVDLLEHNDLVFRVMSWWTLQKLTGKTFYYQPDAPKSKRDSAVKRWRDWLGQFLSGKTSLSKESPATKEAAKPSAPAGPAQQPPQEAPKQPSPVPPADLPNVRKTLPEPPPPNPPLPLPEKAP